MNCLPCDNNCPPCLQNNGCSTFTNLSCSYYSGDDITCLSITKSDTGDDVINKIADALCPLIDGSNDKFVKISETDTTPSYLSNKLKPSKYIGLPTLNPSVNEYKRVDLNFDVLLADLLPRIPVSEDKLVKISLEDQDSAYLENKLIGSDTVAVVKNNSTGNEFLQVGVKIATDEGNAVIYRPTGIYVPIQEAAVESVLTTINSSTITLTPSGVNGHTLLAEARISPTIGNLLTDNNGLFLGASSSDTINFTSTGIGNNLKLTGSVKISEIDGNQLINSDGLYVSSVAARNGLYINQNIVELGTSPLEKDTTLSGDFNLFLSEGKLNIGSSVAVDAKLNVVGNIKVSGKIVNTPQELAYGSTTTWDANLSENAHLTLIGNTTLVITNIEAGTYGTIVIDQDATGSRTITAPANSVVANGGNGILKLTTTPNARDIYVYYFDGVKFNWRKGKNFT